MTSDPLDGIVYNFLLVKENRSIKTAEDRATYGYTAEGNVQ